MWRLATISSLLILGVLSQDENPQNPTVNITQGLVVGSLAEDGDYFKFYGIPYAGSVSGSNRFKAPSPAPIFEDTFVANRSDIRCIRALHAGYEGTEDCLVANIFTSSLDESSRLPVMVWIKGKEFDKENEYHLSFKNFVEQRVVVVSLNFRESVFGYLCLGTEAAPGNAGLKDIIAGLKWVQDNIIKFGGNPGSVTLFGHGSGGAAVDLVTMSPLANNLVHKAIAQSGTALAPWAVTRNNLENALQIAESLNYTINTIEDLSQAFLESSPDDLMAAINALDLTDNSLAFGPCIENEDLVSEDPFLPKSPYKILVNGEFLKIPFMTGFVKNEGTIRSYEAFEKNWLERMNHSFEDFLQSDLQFESHEEKQAVSEQIKSFYVESLDLDENNDTVTLDHYIDYHSDTIVLVSALREARLRSSFANYNLYVYQFSFKGSLGKPLEGPIEMNSAAHSVELAYLFRGITNVNDSTMDVTISDILIERWTNFAKYAYPVSVTSETIWYPFTSQWSACHRILNADEVLDDIFDVQFIDPYPRKNTFWDNIYSEYFLDAESQWELTGRDEGTTTENAETTTENTEYTTEDVETTTSGGGIIIVTTPEPDSTTENQQTTTEFLETSSVNTESTTENQQTTIDASETTTENTETTTEGVETTTSSGGIIIVTTPEPDTTTENQQTTTESLETSSVNTESTTENQQTTIEASETTTENTETTTEDVETTTSSGGIIVVTTPEPDTTTENQQTTTESLETSSVNTESTTENQQTTIEASETTTENTETTTEGVETTTSSGGIIVVTTPEPDTTTVNTESTTENQQTTSEASETTTENTETTTEGVETTTSSGGIIVVTTPEPDITTVNTESTTENQQTTSEASETTIDNTESTTEAVETTTSSGGIIVVTTPEPETSTENQQTTTDNTESTTEDLETTTSGGGIIVVTTPEPDTTTENQQTTTEITEPTTEDVETTTSSEGVIVVSTPEPETTTENQQTTTEIGETTTENVETTTESAGVTVVSTPETTTENQPTTTETEQTTIETEQPTTETEQTTIETEQPTTETEQTTTESEETTTSEEVTTVATTQNPDESEDDNEPGSAPTAVAYTFSILILFSLLAQFHSSQILS